MRIHQPTATMNVITKCERVQPTCVGVGPTGDLIWEGRQMARWQMIMLPVRYAGDFMAHWMMARLRDTGFDSDIKYDSMDISPRRMQTRRLHPGD